MTSSGKASSHSKHHKSSGQSRHHKSARDPSKRGLDTQKKGRDPPEKAGSSKLPASPPPPQHTSTIVVQPPNQTSINTRFWPTAVLRACLDGVDPGTTTLMAQATLLLPSGEELHHQFEGNTTTSGHTVDETGLSSRAGGSSGGTDHYVLYFPFPELAILNMGTYSIRIAVYSIDPLTFEFHLLTWSATDFFTAYDFDVPEEQPTPEEARIIRLLRDTAVRMPETP